VGAPQPPATGNANPPSDTVKELQNENFKKDRDLGLLRQRIAELERKIANQNSELGQIRNEYIVTLQKLNATLHNQRETSPLEIFLNDIAAIKYGITTIIELPTKRTNPPKNGARGPGPYSRQWEEAARHEHARRLAIDPTYKKQPLSTRDIQDTYRKYHPPGFSPRDTPIQIEPVRQPARGEFRPLPIPPAAPGGGGLKPQPSDAQSALPQANDAINPGTASTTVSTSVLTAGLALSSQKLWFIQTGADLTIDALGTTAQATIKNWFGSAQPANLSTILAADGMTLDLGQLPTIVAAMATYASAHPGFNPLTATAMPNDPALTTALAAAWHQ